MNNFAHGNTRDLRVLWALEEIGLPYEVVGTDHPRSDLAFGRRSRERIEGV